MNCLFRPAFFLALALTAVAPLSATTGWAHGSGWSQENAFTITLSFYYADQTPMAYSEVQIFSPADANIPHQKGRSDRNGFFIFKPDAPGAWSFSAADGQGHLSQGQIEVGSEQLNPAVGGAEPASSSLVQSEQPMAKGGASAEGPDPLKIALGLSLIANLALIFLWRKAAGRGQSGAVQQ